MPTLRSRTVLTLEERAERHRLVVRDLLAFTSLLTIIVALTFVTYLLFHSFTAHRQELERRWKQRGETAMRNGEPQRAIESLRSALAYSPDDRGLQVQLATALALAGRTQEALVYFTTLHEGAPGDGPINLQLARLAVRQGNVPAAVESYEAALDGTWNGDGVIRRRETRLELGRYLIAQHRFDEARNQLLIASGNATDNHGLQLTVAGLLEQADGEADAFNLYRKAMAFRETRTAALIGAGRTSAAQGHYLAARNLLEQAAAQSDFGRLPADERAAVHSELDQAGRLLVLFPSTSLMPRQRAIRVAHDATVALNRLQSCSSAPEARMSEPGTGTDKPAPTKPASKDALHSALGAVARAGQSLARRPAAAPPAPAAAEGADPRLAKLQARWQQLSLGPTLTARMVNDPALLESTLLLVYETEKTTAQLCGAPVGEDALLLKIATAPDEIEQP